MAAPTILAFASPRGGTGRTTAALALAWTFGQAGRRVLLVDADPVGSAALVACSGSGACPWPNVRFTSALPPAGDPLWRDVELAIVDAPSLGDPAAPALLRRADAVVLTAAPDPLSLRTVPAALGAISAAQAANARLRLLGVLFPLYNSSDPQHATGRERWRARHGDLLLDPAVPVDPAVRDWPLWPGSPLPAGPAREAYAALAQALGTAAAL